MTALAVTSANSNSLFNSRKAVFRNSSGIPYVLAFYGTTIQVSKGNATTPTSWTHYTYSALGAILVSLTGAMDSTNLLHMCWLEDNGASSDLVYRTFNCNTDAWGANTIVNADIGSDPYFSYLFASITVDSADKPHIAYTAYPSISGAATYALWYINKVAVNWSSSVQVQHVKNRNCASPEIVIDLDGIPVISVTSTVAANGTTVYRGNVNAATSFSEFIINSTTAHHHSGICIAPNGDCYVVSIDGVLSTSVIKLWKHAYASAWSSWTSHDFTFPASAYRNTLPSIFWRNNKLCLFIEDQSDNDIKFASYDGSGWSSLQTLETGTFNTVSVNASFLNNFEKDNTETLIQECTGSASSFETYEQMGQTFEGADCRISKVTFLTSRTPTAITGLLYARLYEVASLTTAPSGIPLAISIDSSDVSTWTTTGTLRTWKFNDVEIKSGKYYAIMLHIPGLGGNQRMNMEYGYMNNPLSGHKVAGTSIYQDSDFYIKLYQKPSSNEIDYVFIDETATPDVWWNILSLAVPSSWVTKSLKWYNGSSWIAKPLKYYNGGSWVTKPIKINM
jgi:hypothetical protein